MDTFLVIDDSTTIQKVVELAFTPYAVKIVAAASYLEAMNAAAGETFSLVIADASLPGIKGARDYADLQSKFDAIPFIILLGSYDGVDQASFHQYGFRRFLPKPFEAGDLVAAAWQALDREIPSKSQAGSPPPVPKPESSPTSLPPTQPSTKIHPATQPGRSVAQSDADSPPTSAMSRLDISDVDVGDFNSDFPEPMVSDIGKLSPRGEGERDYDEARYSAAELTNHLYDDDGVYESDTDDDVSITAGRSSQFSMTDDENDRGTGIDLPAAAFDPPAARDTVVSPKPGSIAEQGSFQPPPPPENFDAEQSSQLDRSQGLSSSSQKDSASSAAAGLIPRDEMIKIVEQTVRDYCERNFETLARDIIKSEIDTLLKEKSRLLIDND